MWELEHKESWAPRNWCFWTVKKELMLFDVGEDSLRVPCTARRSNQSILKEISPECTLEGLILKQKLLYFGHLMWRTDSLEKTPMLGKIEGKIEMVGWHYWLDGHEFVQAPGVGDGQGSLVCCLSWSSKESDTTNQRNWTEPYPSRILTSYIFHFFASLCYILKFFRRILWIP